ncbi:HdeD family acid-resistance protein [Mangrovibacterium diazotrophicum]|uniref:Uncharacterized membrane protein HdeD (DUF308 family) n=1 Tax=Mangrovibacterium diazotrophicum TaxID=1261403 RepID=A0A419W4V8_9BACT|nr:DUF308 domain-containing protein [Mangrovibacterium diazotrophicum]RKD90460.1 uncharacterized membrane protein HdeD (DUF308 family) [Mangrovibacterium diazotrophicum]
MNQINQNSAKQAADGMRKLIMVQGVVLLVVGLILLLFPAASLTTLVFILGVYWLIEGLATVYSAFQQRSHNRHWWWSLISGGLGILAGFIVLAKPGSSTVFTTSFLVSLLGFIAIINGVSALLTANQLKKRQQNGKTYLWRGIFALILGILLIAAPFSSALVIVKIIGIFLILAGLVTIAMARQLKLKASRFA